MKKMKTKFKTLKTLSLVLLMNALGFASFAKAATAVDMCLLESVKAVSPLKEDLNYTKGSGRGYDVVFTKENVAARLGDLHFAVTDGDQIQLQVSKDGTRTYTLTKARTDVQYQMAIFQPGCPGGKYGCGGSTLPGTGRGALLTYTTSKTAPQPLATFHCN